jgi:hypothetical protein
LFVVAPNLADEAYFLGHGCAYLRRDQPKHAIYTLYSVLASHMSRQTLTTFEHRSWGSSRVWDLTPWPMGYYTRMLAGALCWDEGDELVYCRATPRAWLDPGKKIHVADLQTRFGPTTFTLTADERLVRGAIDLPRRYPPSARRLRIRTNGRVLSVKVNGRDAEFDAATESAVIPPERDRVEIEAHIRRDR